MGALRPAAQTRPSKVQRTVLRDIDFIMMNLAFLKLMEGSGGALSLRSIVYLLQTGWPKKCSGLRGDFHVVWKR
jgi:hypothetical protein